MSDPTDRAAEAMNMLDEMNAEGRIAYDDYSRLHDAVGRPLTPRPEMSDARERIARALYVDRRGTTMKPEFVARQWDDGHVVRDEFYRQADVALAALGWES